MRRMLPAALLVLLALALPALAGGEEARAYGGSGEDMLREVVSCGDGLFAAGMTASSNYDLDSRTRAGDAGWALRLDAQGDVRFSFTSARSGMTWMIAPAAFEDGSHAVVLTDDTLQRGEWIVLDENGRQSARVVLPQASALCPHGGAIAQMMSVWMDGEAALAVLMQHEDGRACCARLAQDGSVLTGEAFDAGSGGRMAAGRDGLVYVLVRSGGLSVMRLAAGGIVQEAQHLDDAGIQALGDVMLGEDESVTVGGAGARGGFLLRMSSAGEQIFFLETDAPVTCLTATDTGYAALTDDRILFVDEDGAIFGESAAPENTLDLAASLDGAAALAYIPERGRRQAVFAHVAQPPRMAQESAAAAAQTGIAVGEGYLLCSETDAFGVQVTHMSQDGTALFSVRTPIHTAADRLEWRCAAMLDDGAILLGGRYLSGAGAAQRQQAVAAVIDSGVLRRMETVAGAGAVCAIEVTPTGEILLHAAESETPSLETDMTIAFEQR